MLYAILGLIVILIIVLVVYNVRAGSKETQNNVSSAKAASAKVTPQNSRPASPVGQLGSGMNSPLQEGIQSDDEYRRALRNFQAGEQSSEEQIDGHIDDQDYRDALRRLNRK